MRKKKKRRKTKKHGLIMQLTMLPMPSEEKAL